MQITDFFSLISAVFVFFLSLTIYLKNRKSLLNKIFFAHSFAITVWLVGTFFLFINRDNPTGAIFWDRIIYAGVVFIPALMFHFCLVISRKEIIKYRIILVAGYVFSFLFLLISRTDYFVANVFKYEWGIHTQARIFHHLFLIYFATYVAIGFTIFIKHFLKTNNSLEKERLRYVLVAFLLLFSIGPIAYLPAYNIGIYPFAYLSGLIFTIILFFAIIKHRLFDAQIQFQKIINSFLPFFIVIPFFALFAFYLYDIFPTYKYVIGILLLFFGSLFYKLLYDKISKTPFGHFLFRKTYKYQKALSDLAKDASTILDLEKLSDEIVAVLHREVGIDKVVIVTNVVGAKAYTVLRDCCDLKKKERSKLQRLPIPLLAFLQKTGEPVVREELELSLEYSKDKNKQKFLDIFLAMKELETDLCIPLKLQESLIGVILLGAKEGKRAYSAEDIEIFKELGKELAIAIANSTLHQSKAEQAKLLSEEVRKQTKEIKELYDMKSNFLTVASHQLRTPTSIIRGMLSMLVEEEVPKDKMKEMITSAFKSSSNLERVIEDILTAAEIDSAKFDFTPEAVDIIPIISEVIEDLKLKAEKKSLKLSFKKPAFKKALSLSSPTKIEQVFVNLVDNALNYTIEGSVTVAVEKKEIDGKEYYVFSCKDAGVGMTKEDIGKIGEKFFRSKNVFSVHPNGTGLGVYIVKSIVMSSQGKFWVESKGLGKGSTFYVVLRTVNNKRRKGEKRDE